MKKWINLINNLQIGIAVLVLSGWLFDLEILKRPNAGSSSMNPMSAAGFLFSGITLNFLNNYRGNRKVDLLSGFLALLILFLGSSKLFSIFSEIDLGTDRILFSDKIALDHTLGIRNQMAPNTAFNFVLLGFSLLCTLSDKKKIRVISNFFGFGVLLVGLFSLIGYLYQVREFYGILSYIPMAIHAAVCFILSGLSSLLINREFGFMQPFSNTYSGSKIARILFPFIIIVPILFGYVRVYFNKKYPVSVELGVGFLITGIILAFFILLWFVSYELNKSDIARTDAEKKLSQLNEDLEKLIRARTMDLYKSENRFRTIIEQFPYPVLTYAPDGICTGANLAWEEMWEARRDNLVDYNVRKDPQMESSGLSKYVELAFEGKPAISEPYCYDPNLIGKAGRARWVQLILHPVKNTAGVLLEVIAVQQDITSSKEAENEIRTLNNELEERVKQRTAQLLLVNKELESFSYSVSHDLRAPIRGINGYTQILVEDYGDKLDAEANRIISRIIYNAKQMGQLVDDLLEFSRLGRTELNQREVITKEIVRAIITELRVFEEKREIEFKIGDLPNVHADQTAIRQLWVNLISNAIKYTRKTEQARIEIGSMELEGEKVFFVKDNGAGFNMQYYSKLFGVFQRLHSYDEFEGTGVGLAIVKRIASRHGGKIWADGKIGEGATFYFTLPTKEWDHTSVKTELF